MATFEKCSTITVEAGQAITLYRFLTIAADGQVDEAGSAQGRVDGVSAEAVAAAGDVLPMMVPDGGIAKVEAGASVTRGDVVATDTSGRAITRGASNGDLGWGIALDAASGAGEVIRVQFSFKGQVNA